MYNSKSSDIRARVFKFAARIIKLVYTLPKTPVGYAIGNQIVRSGTSVGANLEEAQNASSKKEFIRGLTISLKEARETEYWLRLIVETELIVKSKLESLIDENVQIIKILTTIIKKTKINANSKLTL